jgi:hypothetical protein
MDYETESGTPERLGAAHVGVSVLYRLPNQAVLSEGEVGAFSPGKKYVKLGRHWLPNRAGTVLAMLETTKTRSTPYDAG